MATASLTKSSESALQSQELNGTPQMRFGGDLRIVSADYTIRAEWDTAYVVDVTVVVDCDESGPRHRFGLGGWKIEFQLEENTKISKIWNAHLDRNGAQCTVVHEKFCSPVSRGRAVLYFGFEAKPAEPTKRVPAPASFTVNGQVCGVTASNARDLADCNYDHLFESRRSSRSPSPEPSRTPSRSPSPDNREPSLPPANASALALSPLMFNRKRLRNSSPSPMADDRPSKKRSAEPHLDEDEKSIAHTPPRTFSPVEDGCEVAAHKPWAEVGLFGNSPPVSPCVSQSDELRKRKAAEDDAAPCDGPTTSPPQPKRHRYPRTLEIDYYRRSKALKERKFLHMDYLDTCFRSREEVILATVLDRESTVLEPNMFPYDCPRGVTHWTLWSKEWLTEEGIADFVDRWLRDNMAGAVEWNHDDNMSDGLSINLFHVHVYIRCSA